MTTIRPKIVVYRFKERPDDMRSSWNYTRLARHVPRGHHGEGLIRLKEYEALQAECDHLRKDKARLDWLADPDNTIGNVELPEKAVLENVHCMRAAIDTAMQLAPVVKQ